MKGLLCLFATLLAAPAWSQSARWLDEGTSAVLAEGALLVGKGVTSVPHLPRDVLIGRGRLAWSYGRLFPSARSVFGSALGVEAGVALDGGPMPGGLSGQVVGGRGHLGVPVRVWLFNDPRVGAIFLRVGLAVASGGAWWHDLVRLQPYGALSLALRANADWQCRAQVQLQPVAFTPWPQDGLVLMRDETSLELGATSGGLELLLRVTEAKGVARFQPKGGPAGSYTTHNVRDWMGALGAGWRF